METDPIPNRDEDFDGDVWDDNPELAAYLVANNLSLAEWLELMTPVWRQQLIEQQRKGFGPWSSG